MVFKVLARVIIALVIVVLFALFVTAVRAQSIDIGKHCPAFTYDGNRFEWDKPFQTTGEAGRNIWFPNTEYVHIEDWCQTTGQGLIPPDYVQSLWYYHDFPKPQGGDAVSYEVTIDFSSGVGEITEKTLLNPVHILPNLSGSLTLVPIDYSGTTIFTAILLVSGRKEAYLQLPDGMIAQLVQ